MGENNKILDVTYGNFSCRLEGFDDSVATMKAVVGYFQDLAGEQMFTDQPSAVPDLDAITRLAAQQTHGQVAVERDERGISLRVHSEEGTIDPEIPADMSADDAHLREGEVTLSEEEFYEDIADDALDFDGFDDDIEESMGTSVEDDVEGAVDDMPAPAAMAPVEPDRQVESDTSIADKLQRIRAVVGRGGPQERDDAFVEDLDNEVAETPKAVNPLAQRLAELAQRNSEMMEADARDEAPVAAEQADEPATPTTTPLSLLRSDRIEDDLAEDDAAETDLVEDDLAEEEIIADVAEVTSDAVEEETASDADVETAEDLTEDTLEAADAELDDDVARELAQNDEDDFDEDKEQARQPHDDVAADDENVVEDEASEPQEPRRARVDSPLLLTTRHQPVTDAGEDDDDDDFDLHEEVAKIERDLAARPGNELARHGLPRTVEDAMSRILMKTDLELDLQETRDGRDAFAQLKAAVAATEAARQLGDTGAKSRDASAMFRDDYGAIEGNEDKGGLSLPPLRLVEPVSEPKPQPAETGTGARLREIAGLTQAKSGSASALTFADFAQAQGASELVDKIEAAAAYLVFVEGETDFSRPQVMRVVQAASSTEVTREDGLRCFGRLLRQSRLVKLNNGRFKISENTRFRPSDDKAARG